MLTDWVAAVRGAIRWRTGGANRESPCAATSYEPIGLKPSGDAAFNVRERRHSRQVLEAFMRRLPPRSRLDPGDVGFGPGAELRRRTNCLPLPRPDAQRCRAQHLRRSTSPEPATSTMRVRLSVHISELIKAMSQFDFCGLPHERRVGLLTVLESLFAA
jgi:hypothetical protein